MKIQEFIFLFLLMGLAFPANALAAESMNHGDDYRSWLKFGADAIGVSQVVQCRPRRNIHFLACKDPLIPNAPSRCRIVGVGAAMSTRKVQIGLPVKKKKKLVTVFQDCAEILVEKPAPENRGCEITIRSCPFLERFVNSDSPRNSKVVHIFQNGLEEEPDLKTLAADTTGLAFLNKAQAISSARLFPGSRDRVVADRDLSALVKRKKLPPPPTAASTLVFTDTGTCRREVSTEDAQGNAETEMIPTDKIASQCCRTNDTGLEDVETRLEYWSKFCTLQRRTYTFRSAAGTGAYRSGEGGTPTRFGPIGKMFVKKGKKKRLIKFEPISVRSLGE
jgi:hypothetical protein